MPRKCQASDQKDSYFPWPHLCACAHTHKPPKLKNILLAGHLRKYSCLGYKDFKLTSATLVDTMETMENVKEMMTYTKIPTGRFILVERGDTGFVPKWKSLSISEKMAAQRASPSEPQIRKERVSWLRVWALESHSHSLNPIISPLHDCALVLAICKMGVK